MHVCVDYDRRTDGADAAVRQCRILHMLNYMLLTVVANGHNCAATATAGYAQGRSGGEDHRWWSTYTSRVGRQHGLQH